MEYPTELKSKHKQRYEISHFESKIGKKKKKIQILVRQALGCLPNSIFPC